MDKIICVGKNYSDHAKELGDAVPEDPTYFLKPPSCLFEATGGDHEVHWPKHYEMHHEVELVLRDLQAQLKKAGLPWEKAKVFANAAIIGALYPLESLEALLDETFTLTVNDEIRQRGRGRDMRWSPTQVLADLPRWFPLREGDLLFTGTPAGVGPLANGDRLRIDGAKVSYVLTVARDL